MDREHFKNGNAAITVVSKKYFAERENSSVLLERYQPLNCDSRSLFYCFKVNLCHREVRIVDVLFMNNGDFGLCC